MWRRSRPLCAHETYGNVSWVGMSFVLTPSPSMCSGQVEVLHQNARDDAGGDVRHIIRHAAAVWWNPPKSPAGRRAASAGQQASVERQCSAATDPRWGRRVYPERRWEPLCMYCTSGRRSVRGGGGTLMPKAALKSRASVGSRAPAANCASSFGWDILHLSFDPVPTRSSF